MVELVGSSWNQLVYELNQWQQFGEESSAIKNANKTLVTANV